MAKLRKFASATLMVGLYASPCFADEYSKCINAWPANRTVIWGAWRDKCSRESHAKPVVAFGMTWTGPYLVHLIENVKRRDPDFEKHPDMFAAVLEAFEASIPQNEKPEVERFIRLYHPGPGASTYTVLSGGAISCGEFLQGDEELQSDGLFWIQGFLTDVSEEPLVGKKTDYEGLKTWLRNYCQIHPLEHLIDAAHALRSELIGNGN
jgi:hypothetical protein